METPAIAELPKHLSDRGRTIWVDLEDPTDEETGVLGGIFGFHILSVEDCIDDAWLPKEDAYDGYTYSVFHAAAPTGLDRLVAQKLDIFVGPNFLVTYHAEEIKGIFDTRGVVAKNPGSLLRSSDWLLHGVLNTVIDFCMPAVEALEARVNRIADAGANAAVDLDDAVDLHRDLIAFRAITENQKGALERFAYSESSFVAEENKDYFRDVHDHNRHLHFRLDQAVERLSWALETLKASDARRTQRAVRWGVALLTAVLLPLLVLGLLSLKMFTLSEQVSPIALGVIVAYVIGVLLIFKQKRWF
jgi:magnesium transporter